MTFARAWCWCPVRFPRPRPEGVGLQVRRGGLIGLALLASIQPAAALDGKARVVDGDTMVIGAERVRLRNYNAPELDQPGGPEARAALMTIIGDQVVHCTPKARDRYARLVALCEVGGVDLGEAMQRRPQ